MKEKFKYNFFHFISLYHSKFYNCFLLCFSQDCHFFCNTECLTGAPKSHCTRGINFKNRHLIFLKDTFLSQKIFHSYFYRFAISYRDRFQSKNVVMTKKRCTLTISV